MNGSVLVFVFARWVHVLTAVLGTGQVAALAFLARSVRLAPHEETSALLRRLVVLFSWSLLVMLVTGVLMALLVGPAFERTIWFRASSVLVLVVGALAGMMGGALKRKAALRAEGLAWGMVGVVAIMALLMVAKP
jgi:hypothetical protein